MTLLAFGPKPCRTVGGVCSRFICALMAAYAVDRNVHIFLLLLVDMAGLTRERLVRTHQRKARAVMSLRHIRNKPRLGRMTAVAGFSKLIPVKVSMTACTRRLRSGKLQVLVALTA